LDYSEALSYIHSLPRFSDKPGLERLRRLLEQVGNPQDQTKHVHVAGTNGKGSVTAIVAAILTAAGYKTGMYTSPHLQHFSERILVNGRPLDPEDLTRLLEGLRMLNEHGRLTSGESLIEFEMITALAFMHYASVGCDIVSLEVGLGGRYDATNVIKPPLAAAISSIGHDHTEILGSTLAEIAREKAGIIKPGTMVVSAVRPPEARAVIAEITAECGATLWQVSAAEDEHAHITWVRTGSSIGGQCFDLELPGVAYRGLRLGMLGLHQIENAACALGVVHALRQTGRCVPESAIRDGLARASWPGRFEVLSRKPYVIIDGAHNPEGAAALASTYRELFPDRRCVLVMGVLGDKDVGPVVETLGPLARRVIVTKPNHPTRSLEPERLAQVVREAGLPADVHVPASHAIRVGLGALEDSEDVLLITGSLYLIGEARTILRRVE